MRTIGLVEAKRKLSEIVKRASRGERTGITLRGQLVAIVIPGRPEKTLDKVFADIERIRKKARISKPLTIKDLIGHGRT